MVDGGIGASVRKHMVSFPLSLPSATRTKLGTKYPEAPLRIAMGKSEDISRVQTSTQQG